ncbi:HAD family hydrolase [Rhodophyticola sp. CCM32]|uniref:HAD family hydrolase n=1 Tax=Rhodophyticola sp. CCM32 TaxID=2916397 RepID=UPI00107FC61D|nr:HAD family hydrolase [Rhodophyticola sp. CCM32]QBY01424.1 HAD family hydrolase [Rhodophyticola sp. CCM32]
MSKPIPESVSRYEAVCFDLFGTLVEVSDQRGVWRDVLALVPCEKRRQFGHRILRENRSMKNLVSELYPPEDTSRWKTIADNTAAEARSTQMRAGMSCIWSKLQRNGQKLGICSNLSQDYGPPAIEQLPTLPDVRALSYELGCAKPDPEIYQYVVDSFGYRPEQVLFVGDTPKTGILGPRRLGIDAMHIREFEKLFSVPG